ncbi:MAG: domain containing protein [Bacteroidetes bacterium]|nr:domain containing protein [Bacteroidota bacterium]
MNKITLSGKTFGKTVAFLALTGLSFSGFSQNILFNNGAQIYTGPTAIVQVNGGFQNDGAAGTTPVFENNGTMTIANSGTPGTVRLTNGSTLQGNGTYNVEQDWINDATFTAGTSTVNLDGNLQQFVTSTTATVTTFNNLTLTGTGTAANRKKTLQLVNANIGTTGTLAINDRELETQTNTMFVLNPSTTCVTNNTTAFNEGFVSSSVGGSLSRVTNTAAVYNFPTGSSLGTTRYRPVNLTPASASANQYNARLGNNNATLDAFNTASLDSTMCTVNALYYHQVNHSAGADNASIDIFYDQAGDGNWDGMAQWNTPTAARWNNMGTVTNTTASPYNDMLKVSWADFSNSPYILARIRPDMPVFACAPVCANSTGNTFTATGGTGTYTWTSPAGTTIASGQGTGTVEIDWNNASGPISVTTSSALGCVSYPSSCTVTVSTPPVVAFDTASAGGFNYNFTDQSTGGATNWAWNFGDGSSSSAQNPSHNYSGNGIQNVCLTASNSDGCSATACEDIIIDATEYLNIPNVFTPDGDGTNDLFYINSSGLTNFNLDIFNRWGTKVFTSNDAGIKWDGRSSAGVELSDGTYYFILKGTSISKKDVSTTGFINLIRNK